MVAEQIDEIEKYFYIETLVSRFISEALERIVASRTKTVTDPWLGHNIGRLLRDFDFFAQLTDRDAQVFGLVSIRAPHGMQ